MFSHLAFKKFIPITFSIMAVMALSGCITKQMDNKCPDSVTSSGKGDKTAKPKTLIEYLNRNCEPIDKKENIVKKKRPARTAATTRTTKPKVVPVSKPDDSELIEEPEIYTPPAITGRINHSMDSLFEQKNTSDTPVLKKDTKAPEVEPVVREYNPKRAIRVVGPKYLHSPSTAADQPTQDQTDAQ